MIGCSKKNRENYPGKCFGTKEKETGLGFNRGLALIGFPTTGPWGRKANNWAQKRIGQRSEPSGEGEWVAEALPPLFPLNPKFHQSPVLFPSLAPLSAFFIHQRPFFQAKRHRLMTLSSEPWNEVLHHSQHVLLVFQSPACCARLTWAHSSGTNSVVACEKSVHIETPPLLLSRNDVWETSAESPY